MDPTPNPPRPVDRDYHQGPVVMRGSKVPGSTTDARLLDSGGSADWLRGTAAEAGTINLRDLDLLTVTDDVDEAIAAIVAAETPSGGLGGVRQPPAGPASPTPAATRPE